MRFGSQPLSFIRTQRDFPFTPSSSVFLFSRLDVISNLSLIKNADQYFGADCSE